MPGLDSRGVILEWGSQRHASPRSYRMPWWCWVCHRQRGVWDRVYNWPAPLCLRIRVSRGCMHNIVLVYWGKAWQHESWKTQSGLESWEAWFAMAAKQEKGVRKGDRCRRRPLSRPRQPRLDTLSARPAAFFMQVTGHTPQLVGGNWCLHHQRCFEVRTLCGVPWIPERRALKEAPIWLESATEPSHGPVLVVVQCLVS